MDREQLFDDLVRDEGLKLEIYKCTAGKLTIGVGRNIEDRGITTSEARLLLANDVDIISDELTNNFPWWVSMPEPAQRALANMAFNLGVPRLCQFKNMLSALKKGDYNVAAKEALDSNWAKQVGDRANRIAKVFRELDFNKNNN
tara:strand:- start:173 stop:604 length:432 start_codon:yes stop_codon:yes gene_type:complete